MKRFYPITILTLLLTFPVLADAQTPQTGIPQTQQQVNQPSIGAPVAVTPEEQKDIDSIRLNLENISLKVKLLSAEVSSRVADFKAQFDSYSAELSSLITKIKAAHGYGPDVVFDSQESGKLVKLGNAPNQDPAPVPPSTALNQPKPSAPPSPQPKQ